MTTRKEVYCTGIQEHLLRNNISELIYEGDWEVRGRLSSQYSDITDHYLIDEDTVITAIIKAVREADLQ